MDNKVIGILCIGVGIAIITTLLLCQTRIQSQVAGNIIGALAMGIGGGIACFGIIMCAGGGLRF